MIESAISPVPPASIRDVSTLLALTPEEALESVTAWGEPKYRAQQIVEWIYQRRVQKIEEMTNLSRGLRQKLTEWKPLRTMEVAQVQGAQDATQKFLFRLQDRRYVESVFIRANVTEDGERADRRTLCVSSQVGCAYDCKFCASGLAGFARNLRTDEIIEQVVQVEAHSGQRVDNMVFMGMGEPLANLTNLLKALTILQAPWGIGIGARHMTVSTSGLAPQIKKLADAPVPVRLAISLHGATDAVRSQIMPVNDKYPLDVLFEALAYFKERRKQKISFEYILIEGVNDGLDQARALVRRARGLSAKINLIPYNTVEGLPWKRPEVAQQQAFCDVLNNAGITATIRHEKGHDIDAACGQLRLRQEQADGTIS